MAGSIEIFILDTTTMMMIDGKTTGHIGPARAGQ